MGNPATTTAETMTTTIATTSMSTMTPPTMTGNRARDASARDAETPRAPGIFYFFLSSYCINYLQLDHVYGVENMMTMRPLPPPQIPGMINGTTTTTARQHWANGSNNNGTQVTGAQPLQATTSWRQRQWQQ